ncbi:2420_t:CDS:2 [Entrophospora sp. SA101]
MSVKTINEINELLALLEEEKKHLQQNFKKRNTNLETGHSNWIILELIKKNIQNRRDYTKRKEKKRANKIDNDDVSGGNFAPGGNSALNGDNSAPNSGDSAVSGDNNLVNDIDFFDRSNKRKPKDKSSPSKKSKKSPAKKENKNTRPKRNFNKNI